MKTRTTLGMLLCKGIVVAMPTMAQRRGETMKVTPADDRKALVTPTDEGFVRNASGGYQAGSKLVMLAAVRATNPQLKALGETMVKDFIALGDRLKPAASGEKGYQWSHEAPPEADKCLDALERLSGAELDKALRTQLVAVMKGMKAAFATEAEKGRDPDLKPIAQQSGPWIEKRLREARSLDLGSHGK